MLTNTQPLKYTGTPARFSLTFRATCESTQLKSTTTLTHSLTDVPASVRTDVKNTLKKKIKRKKLTHVCIVGDKIAHLHIQMSFPHFIHIPTFYPQSFPHFWGSYPHFSGTFPHVFHIFWRVFHNFLEFPTFYRHSHICIFTYLHIFTYFQRLYIQKYTCFLAS